MIRGKDLHGIKIGQKVYALCGPSDNYLTPGMSGEVETIETSRWGTALIIKLANGARYSALSLGDKDQGDLGIGWYTYH